VYDVWIVSRASMEKITLGASTLDVHESLASASRLLKGMGAPLLEARNVTDPWHTGTKAPSMLVYDPSDSLPLAAVIEGACLCEGGMPLPPHETTDMVPMHDAPAGVH
jgi:hypothetical protein